MNDIDAGWGSETEDREWGLIGSTALVVTAGLYWASLWIVSGLAPLPSFVTTSLRRHGLALQLQKNLRTGQVGGKENAHR